ncbi:MAG: 1-deoxy-D-xylulose-5-phosphate reductoisomerase [Candidatus Sumerlaeales bacterium]|nr:1-deoxy-D-xylulose-5-phosphate reductoisomerase [Candidatus Sumerlaeales bacterium]
MSSKKRILLLGSTGSIGRRTIDVISDFPDLFEIAGLATNTNTELLMRQLDKFKVPFVCVSDTAAAEQVRGEIEAHNTCLLTGENALSELVERAEADIVLVATVGFTGLRPTVRAIECGCTIALANKEVLVAAGDFVMDLAQRHSVKILPVDSEHNAIFQCLQSCTKQSDVYKLVLTASGGPFRNYTPEQMESITVEQALKHPTWNMGRKITIDSATMMNKGFEVIEAMHLFSVTAAQIKVLIHPQSIIHSMVTFVDGLSLAQLGRTDMYLPIQYALTYPKRLANPLPRLDLAMMEKLTFYKPNLKLFPCLQLAYDAIDMGGVATVALNAANEVAVAQFLNREIKFTQIADVIRRGLEQTPDLKADSLENIFMTDNKIRTLAVSNSLK